MMKLKDLKTDAGNLFDEMEIFKDLGDIDSYYREFIYLYGERDLINKVELMFNENGLTEVGWLFTLKTSKWLDLQLIDDKINIYVPIGGHLLKCSFLYKKCCFLVNKKEVC